jgi:hypothetical protein
VGRSFFDILSSACGHCATIIALYAFTTDAILCIVDRYVEGHPQLTDDAK